VNKSDYLMNSLQIKVFSVGFNPRPACFGRFQQIETIVIPPEVLPITIPLDQSVEQLYSGLSRPGHIQEALDHPDPKQHQSFVVTALGRVWNPLTVVIVPNSLADAKPCFRFLQMRKIPEGYGQVGPVAPLRAGQSAFFKSLHIRGKLLKRVIKFLLLLHLKNGWCLQKVTTD
jgi:hypothetical protein